jgi:predicted ATP-grasp superfamily ATP-dependent carboligase
VVIVEEEMIQYLISIGALEYVFDDEDGEPVYRLTEEAKDLVPDLYEEHMKDFNSVVFSLWSKNLVDVVFDEDGEPMIGLNVNTDDLEMIEELDKQEKEVLEEILHIWKKKTEG